MVIIDTTADNDTLPFVDDSINSIVIATIAIAQIPAENHVKEGFIAGNRVKNVAVAIRVMVVAIKVCKAFIYFS